MLPTEILALVLLAAKTLAIPTALPTAQNATEAVATSSRRGVPSSAAKVHAESTVPGWDLTADLRQQLKTTAETCSADCGALPVNRESTVSGFESPQSSAVVTTERAQVIVTTSTPTVIGIKTNFETPGESRTTIRPQQTASESLLEDILSRVTNPPLSTSSPSSPMDSSSERNEQAPDGELVESITWRPDTKGSPMSASLGGEAPSIDVGGQITFSSAVLTLTPGLSSVIGDGPEATMVAISTDDNGQTLITVSSSGTAVTATITNAPTTVTRPNDIETSATAPGLGNPKGSIAGLPAAPTSSQGAAMIGRGSSGRWLCMLMWLSGVGLVG